MFYQPKPENYLAFACLDNNEQTYLLFEPAREDSRLEPYAFDMGDYTLAQADEIAKTFNETGSYIIRGSEPLTGKDIPTLHKLPAS